MKGFDSVDEGLGFCVEVGDVDICCWGFVNEVWGCCFLFEGYCDGGFIGELNFIFGWFWVGSLLFKVEMNWSIIIWGLKVLGFMVLGNLR